MSRGPGRIERAITETFAARPDKGLTVHALCCHIWNDGFDYGPTHAQRSSVLRAAGKVAKRMSLVRFHLNNRHNETFFISQAHPYVAEQQRKKEEGERWRAEFEAQKQLAELKFLLDRLIEAQGGEEALMGNVGSYSSTNGV